LSLLHRPVHGRDSCTDLRGAIVCAASATNTAGAVSSPTGTAKARSRERIRGRIRPRTEPDLGPAPASVRIVRRTQNLPVVPVPVLRQRRISPYKTRAVPVVHATGARQAGSVLAATRTPIARSPSPSHLRQGLKTIPYLGPSVTGTADHAIFPAGVCSGTLPTERARPTYRSERTALVHGR